MQNPGSRSDRDRTPTSSEPAQIAHRHSLLATTRRQDRYTRPHLQSPHPQLGGHPPHPRQRASLPLASLTLRIAAHSCTKRCVVYAYTPDTGSAGRDRELRADSLPDRPRCPLIAAPRQAGRRRRPHVAACRQRVVLGARALEQGVEVLPSHPEGAADAHRRQDALVDPVADRRRRDLESRRGGRSQRSLRGACAEAPRLRGHPARPRG